MKILVAAKRVSPNTTSEGICSSKYIAALAAGGHDVTCITAEDAGGAAPAGAPRLNVLQLTDAPEDGVEARVARWSRRLVSTGSLGTYADRKLNAACAYGTGYSMHVWEAVARWRSALSAAIEREGPDAVIVRGAGREFEPHMAMLNWKPPVPWIAHYHDPYPASLYPEPYRQKTRLLSSRQERVHRQILAQADALTFPSQRLLDWVLAGEHGRYRHKAFVVPHIASGPHTGGDEDADAETLEAGCLNLLHAGTLLRERDPRALLRGFLAFVGADAERRRLARLVFVGRVDRTHSDHGEWQMLSREGLLRSIERRLSYRAASRLSQAADCLVLIEANAEVSPFFPAKLSDYLWAGRPIVALSPPESATADLLEAEYPLRVSPGDTVSVAVALERVWTAWRAGQLAELVPRRAIATSLSATAVRRHTEEILGLMRAGRVGRAA
jgi:hypothetical protein